MEKELTAVFDCISEGVAYKDASGRIRLFNQAAEAILGLSRQQAQGLTSQNHDWGMIHEDGSPCLPHEHPSMITLRTGQAQSDQVRGIKKPGGGVTWLSINTRPHYEPGQSQPAGVVISFRDITPRKQIEEAPRARLRLMDLGAGCSLKNLLRQILDEVGQLVESPIGFFHFVEPDQKTLRLQAWSTRTVAEFCTAQGEGLHYSLDQAGVWADCLHQRQAVIHNDYAGLGHRKGLPPGHVPVVRELVVPIFRDGRIVAILGVGNKPQPYTDEDAALVSHMADWSWDIAQRKLAEEELRQHHRRLDVALATVDLAVFQQDRDLRYTWMYKPQLGYGASQVVGRTDAELLPAQDAALVTEIKRGVLASGQGARQEVPVTTPQGTLTFDLVVEPLLDHDGAVVGITGSSLNITERKRAEEELRYLEAQLRQAHKMQAVGTLAAGVAHEFNNLLAVIMGYAELARDEAQGRRDILDDLAPILTACQRGRDLVKQLAAFSRQAEPQARPLNLNQQIAATGEMLERLLPRAVTVHTSLAPDLPIVGMDAGHFQQVLIGLANNAAQVMPAGGRLDIETASVTLGPTVCATCGETFSGDFVLLKVRDSGPGMEPETARRVFEPFFTTKGVGGGVGLGLSAAQGIIKSHGGHIICQSALGRGTCLEVYLPVYRVDQDAAPPEVSPAPAGAAGQETILLVDDEEGLRDLGQRLLGQAGYTVLTAQNGEKALRIFQEDPAAIALVLLDLGMPGMGGHRCLQELLALVPRAKVVVASGYTSDGQDQQALAAGAQAFVAKPFRKAELLGVIREVLDRGASA